MKWFLLAAAVVCHVAYADECEYGTECLTCHNVTSYQACEDENNYVMCSGDNPVCLVEWHYIKLIGVSHLSSQCSSSDTCNRLSNVQTVRQCRGSSPIKQDITRELTVPRPRKPIVCCQCIHGRCKEPCQKHCFTCCGKSDVACLITGQYKECLGDQSCFYTTKPNGHVERGCKPNESCDDDECEDSGEVIPSPPWYDVSVCDAPDYGVCSCKGDPHCDTFDMKRIPNLVGGCSTHLMARDKCAYGHGNSSFLVSVNLKKLASGRVVVDSVKIEYHGHVVVLGQTIGMVDIDLNSVDCSDTTISTPYVEYNIEVAAVAGGKAVRVMLANGVVVHWDWDRAVGINVPNNLTDLCGVCGNYNGDPSDDLVYGPVFEALEVCPAKADLLQGKTEGSNVFSDIEGFSYSWIKDGCEETCGT